VPLIEIDFVKVQKRAHGNFMITVPATAVKDLNLKGSERVKVLFDKQQKRLVYDFGTS
jgi:hypothetical protein